MKNTEIYKRLTSESPSFFKKIGAICVTLLAAGTAILAIPSTLVVLPPIVNTLAGYMIAAGTVGGAIAKATVSDPAVLKKDEEVK